MQLESTRDEVIELKEQLELKERTIQRLRTTSTRARAKTSSAGLEVKALELQIKEVRVELRLEQRQRRSIAEDALATMRTLDCSKLKNNYKKIMKSKRGRLKAFRHVCSRMQKRQPRRTKKGKKLLKI